MAQEITQHPAILDESYVIEFVEDPGLVYESGRCMDAAEFIEDYCECNSPPLN